MSGKKNIDWRVAYERLQRAAASGDPRAKAELGKLVSALQQGGSQMLGLALVEQVEDEVVGEETGDGEEIFAGDDLDLADRIAQTMPNADSLTQKTAFRQQKWQGLDNSAKFVRIQPPTVLQGITGNSADVTSGGDPKQVVNWVGADDAEAAPLSIILAPVALVAPTPHVNTSFRPFAILRFGVKGLPTLAEVDIGTGCELTVCGSSLVVQVAMDPPGPSQVAGDMKLAGMLAGFTAIERESFITRTRYIDGLAAVQSTTVTVPPFAKSFNVLVSNPADGTQVDLIDGGNNAVATIIIAPNTYHLFGPIPLSGDAVAVTIHNQSVADTLNYRIIFNLAF